MLVRQHPPLSQVMAVNLRAPWYLTAKLLPLLEAAKGSVVNTSSIMQVGGHVVLPGNLSYSLAKGGVAYLTKESAVAFAPKGVRVNAVSPGVVPTSFMGAVGMTAGQQAAFFRSMGNPSHWSGGP